MADTVTAKESFVPKHVSYSFFSLSHCYLLFKQILFFVPLSKIFFLCHYQKHVCYSQTRKTNESGEMLKKIQMKKIQMKKIHLNAKYPRMSVAT